MLIYLAASQLSEVEVHVNQQLAMTLERWGYRVFLPQRDRTGHNGVTYDTTTPEERRKALFHIDKTKILEADIFLLVLNGRTPDEGVCVELGLAHAYKELRQHKKVLIGFSADAKAGTPQSKLHPMLRVPLDRIVDSEDELLYCLRHYQEQGTLGLKR